MRKLGRQSYTRIVEDEIGFTGWWPTYPGAIFVDASAAFRCEGVDISGFAGVAGTFTPYKIILYDSSLEECTGFLAEADAAEALGTAVFDDDCQDDDTGDWTIVDCTLNSVAADGDTAHYTVDYVATTQWVKQDSTISFVSGQLYKYSFAIRSGTVSSGTLYFKVGSTATTGDVLNRSVGASTASWVTKTGYFIPVSDTDSFGFLSYMTGAGNWKIKDIWVKPVTALGADGCDVVSAKNGSTQNWASKSGSFDYNDGSGYTFDIITA